MERHRDLMRMYLSESLRELMVQRMFEKITIKMICDKAGVIRATFYNYFDDKYDCLDTIIRQDLDMPSDTDTIGQGILEVCRRIEENREFYKAAYQVTGQNSFEDMIRRNLSVTLENYLDTHRNPQTMPEYSNALLARYYADGMAFVIREFAFQKEPIHDAEGMADMVLDLMRTSILDLLH